MVWESKCSPLKERASKVGLSRKCGLERAPKRSRVPKQSRVGKPAYHSRIGYKSRAEYTQLNRLPKAEQGYSKMGQDSQNGRKVQSKDRAERGAQAE